MCCRCVRFHFVVFQFAIQLWVMVILLRSKITLDDWKHQFGSVFLLFCMRMNFECGHQTAALRDVIHKICNPLKPVALETNTEIKHRICKPLEHTVISSYGARYDFHKNVSQPQQWKSIHLDWRMALSHLMHNCAKSKCEYAYNKYICSVRYA